VWGRLAPLTPPSPAKGGCGRAPAPGPISSLPFPHSSQMNSDDLLALPARCPMSLAAGGRVIPPIGAVVMACLAYCRGRGHLWISFASSVCPFPMASRLGLL